MNTLHLPPDPEEMNDRRAVAAEEALLTFARVMGETDEDGNLGPFVAQNISDFLADLAHFCDRTGVAMLKCLANARSNYLEETDEVGRQFAD